MKQAAQSAPCRELEPDLVLFHYDELNDVKRQRLEAHLSNCPACRQFIGKLAGLLRQTVLADEPPAAFWNSYSRELNRKLAQLNSCPKKSSHGGRSGACGLNTRKGNAPL